MEEINYEEKYKNCNLSTQTVIAYTNLEFNLNLLLPCLEDLKDKFIEEVLENLEQKEKIEQKETFVLNNIIKQKTIKGEYGKIYVVSCPKKQRQIYSKKDQNFRNQISLKIFIDKFITVKIFRTGCIHLTGIKTKEQQILTIIEILKILKNNLKIKNLYKLVKKKEIDDINPDEKKIKILFDIVMINLDFNLNMIINKIELDKKVQENKNFFSCYESTGATSSGVNIKKEYKIPEKYNYDFYIIDENNFSYKKQINELNKEKIEKIKNTKTDKIVKKKITLPKVTFMVFNSGKVLLSGRFYETCMFSAFKEFLEFIYKNKNEIIFKKIVYPINFESLNFFYKELKFNQKELCNNKNSGKNILLN